MKNLIRLLVFLGTMLLHHGVAFSSATAGKYVPVDAPSKTAQVVTLGFYPISVYALDISSSTYYIDTYLWMRWKGDIDPTTTLEFTNMVEEWGKQQENLMEEPEQLPDGSNYQVMRVEGRFVQPFSLEDFPLDRQKLSIVGENSKYGADLVAYQLDREDSGVGEGVKIPGWNLIGWSGGTYRHEYGTQFGAVAGNSAATSFSSFEFALNVERPTSFFFWKLFFPLTIVLCASWVVLLLDVRLTDVRTAMPATALLTTVFLQQSYSSNLPDIGYLVLIDKLYVVAYILIILTLLRTIIVSKKIESADQVLLKKIQFADRLVLGFQVVVFASAAVALVMTRGA